MWCRRCGIRFLTHPRNGRRRDLHCPFGCREHHGKELARQRSARHRQKAEARWNKKLLNARRSCRVQSLPDGNAVACGNPAAYGGRAPHRDLAQDSHPASREEPAEPVLREEPAWPAEPTFHDKGTSHDGPGPQRDLAHQAHPACRQEPASHVDLGPCDLARSVDCDSPTPKPFPVQSACSSVIVGCLEPTPCKGQLQLEGVLLQQASVLHSPILPYVRMVASLIEGRNISLAELVAALRTAMRQRSIANRTRIDYVLGFLHQHPP